MKLLAALVFSLVTGTALAGELSFSCEMNSDITYKNQFALKVTGVDKDATTFENLELDFTFRRAGRDSQLERLSVTRDGMLSVFPEGLFAKGVSYGLVSAVKNDPVEYIGIFVDFAGFFHAHIRMLDGMTYFSTCKSL